MSSVLLHVLPGSLIFVAYLVATPALASFGVPRAGAILLAFVIVGMPLELGILKRAAAREGKSSILEVIQFRKPMSFWLAALLVAGTFTLAVAMLMYLPFYRVSTFLAERVFWWFPAAALPAPETPGAGKLVLLTLIAQVVIDGVANPIVEELYFRGYLLPRLATLGWLAPVVNTFLFALGHLWQPYNYLTIFLLVLPLTCITWWRKNIYVQMVAHCLANTIGASISLAGYFGQ